MIFRWYGYNDSIKLKYIKQIPNVTGIVTSLYDKEAGTIWDEDEIKVLKDYINSYNLDFEVVESLPVSEDIKLKTGSYLAHIDAYKKNIRLLAKYGIKCICYNFMPIFDWTRTRLDYKLDDESLTLAYIDEDIKNIDINSINLPGWNKSYKNGEIYDLITKYKKLGVEGLWKNLEYFLKEIIPVAIECDVLMAIHPDDPPFDIFGIPRIINNENNIDRLLNIVCDNHNGLTMCSASLGSYNNDIVSLITKYAKMNRIHFAHIRNIKKLGDKSFVETAHYSKCGSLDMVNIVKAYYDAGYNKYVRPDHGRTIFDEKAKYGYGLYDRALGVTYINGIWETLEKIRRND